MTDRELLELAAKAWFGNHPHCWNEPVYAYEGGEKIKEGGFWDYATNGELWNPLEDDGDALRLAVTLRMCMQFTAYYAVCYSGSPAAMQFTEQATMGYSIEEATRRAIVRAAAEIGRLQG